MNSIMDVRIVVEILFMVVVLYVGYSVEKLRVSIMREILCIKERLAKMEAVIDYIRSNKE